MYNLIKRSFDFIISLVGMPFLGIILLFSVICIKLEDGGPVLYIAERTGRYGKPFRMYKIRSMKVDAPDIWMEDGSAYNAEDDPRVTKFGKFARKTSIDELPQLINILKGDMSFVGPRPDSVSYLNKYTEEEKIILTVRPGVTGYNQAVNRNAVGTKEKLQNDIYYVKNKSLLFDFKIVIMTIKTVLLTKNIYRVTNDLDSNIEENRDKK